MVDINVILPVFMLLIFAMAFPLLLQFYVKSRTKDRHLCAIIEKGKPLTIKLLKISRDDFVRDKGDEWFLKTNLMKPIDYPIGWPKILSSFQQSVWCSLLMRGRSDPLDWENPPAGALSSKELPVVLDPHWLVNLVKGVGEGVGPSKGEKILAMIAAGASVIALLAVFYLISRVGAIEQAIEALRMVR